MRASGPRAGRSELTRSQRVRALLPEVWSLVKPRRWLFALGLALMAINRVCGLVLPASTMFFVDDIVMKRRSDLLLALVATVLAATAVKAVTSFALTQLLSRAAQRVTAELRCRVQAHMGRLPVAYFDSNKTGSLVSRIMNDIEGIRNLIGTGLLDFAGGALTAAIALFVLFSISVPMTVIALSFFLFFGVVFRRAFSKMRPFYRQRGQIYAEVTGRLTESLSGVRVVKGYSAEAREADVFAGGVERLLDNVIKTLTAISTMGLSSTLLLGGAGAAVIYFGAEQILAGRMTLGGFFTYTIFLGFFMAPISQIVSLGAQLTEALACLERTREVLSEKPEDEDPRRTVTLS
ncbi:MAG: ABC transporter transmembrane domain-containing protein, partial [Thermoanaerobaculia bacterium]